MSAAAVDAAGFGVPEYLSWDELQQLPDEIAESIELWEHRVIWNRRAPLAHQRFSRRVCAAIESEARRAMESTASAGEEQCWQVETETNVFFKNDKSSFLTPDFLVRRCMPGLADTMASDVMLVGEVLSGSDTRERVDWKKERYADGGIPWYWEVTLDSADTPAITAVRAYELVLIETAGLKVKPLRPAMYALAGEWEPAGLGIDFPEPFDMHISWDDLAF